MPHLRKRHILTQLRKLAAYWPVVGVLGLRQSGKSTVFRDLLGIGNLKTLDDETTLDDVHLSAKNFLLKVGTPVVIDEAQKAPKLFDAIKLLVDRKKRPGSYFLTGSSQFSAKQGICESLTGRIGLIHLYPFTLAEAGQLELDPDRALPLHRIAPRFRIDDALPCFASGGLPVPLFTRDLEQRKLYFRNWLETAVLRDAGRVYGRSYDPDVAWSILRQMGAALREGELPGLTHFKQSSRLLRKYLSALDESFVLRKIPCHEAGTGSDAWLPADGGLATEIMGTEVGEGASLTLARVFVFNELMANAEYSGRPVRPVYFKSARGSPVDLVWDDVLVKISVLPKSQVRYDERPLAGAMKTLGLNRGVLVTPRDEVEITRKGVSQVPWTYWS